VVRAVRLGYRVRAVVAAAVAAVLAGFITLLPVPLAAPYKPLAGLLAEAMEIPVMLVRQRPEVVRVVPPELLIKVLKLVIRELRELDKMAVPGGLVALEVRGQRLPRSVITLLGVPQETPEMLVIPVGPGPQVTAAMGLVMEVLALLNIIHTHALLVTETPALREIPAHLQIQALLPPVAMEVAAVAVAVVLGDPEVMVDREAAVLQEHQGLLEIPVPPDQQERRLLITV
jgi:hypothetical protein